MLQDGYVADVAYAGEAQYPEYKPSYPASQAPAPAYNPAPVYSAAPKEVAAEDNDEVKEAIMKSINTVNRKAVSKAQKVHKYMIAPTDFSLAGGELTPTLKMKRFYITEKYEKEIERMFEYETQSSMW